MFQRRVLAKSLMRLLPDVARLPTHAEAGQSISAEARAGEKLYIALKKRNGRQVQFTPAAPKPLPPIATGQIRLTIDDYF
jgi:hypothetical protein